MAENKAKKKVVKKKENKEEKELMELQNIVVHMHSKLDKMESDLKKVLKRMGL